MPLVACPRLLACGEDERLRARLHRVADGGLELERSLDLPGPAAVEVAFVEVVNRHALVKRVGGNLAVVDLAASASRSIGGTEDLPLGAVVSSFCRPHSAHVRLMHRSTIRCAASGRPTRSPSGKQCGWVFHVEVDAGVAGRGSAVQL